MGKRKFIILALVILVVAGATAYGLFWWQAGPPKNLLRLQGHMEATETDLSFKVSGLIETSYFQEGDWVAEGQKVAALEAKDLKDEVDRARANMAAARANLAKLEAGYRPQEIKEAEAQVGKTRADLANKKIDYERYENLHRRKVVAALTRDKFEADYLMAKENYKSALEEFSLRKEGFRKEDIDKGREDFKSSQAALELALTRLGYATITSPVNGVVLVRPMEPGMTVAVGSPVVTLGDLGNIYFEGYIPESEQARVKFGMKAEITTDSYPGKKYPAWVSFINKKAEFTPKTVETYKERITLVYRTKIRAQNLDYDLKPGMPADAVIFLDSQPDEQPESHDKAIKAQGLTRRFGGLVAVDHLDLEVAYGEAFALVGPDAAGKTTTMRLLVGIMDPDEGAAEVLGFDTVRESERLKEQIGYMPQRFGLYDDLTVAENIAFYADLYQVDRGERDRRLPELLGFSNLTAFTDRLARNLSGGMRQKLGLVCALIHTPRMLFLDEPTFGVDPVSRREFWEILYRLLGGGLTIFLSTAYLDEAERAHRVGLMHHGRLLVVDTPKAIKGSFEGELLEARAADLWAARQILSGQTLVQQCLAMGDHLMLTVASRVAASGLIEALTQAGLTEVSVTPAEPNLEDLFVQIVRRQQV